MLSAEEAKNMSVDGMGLDWGRLDGLFYDYEDLELAWRDFFDRKGRPPNMGEFFLAYNCLHGKKFGEPANKKRFSDAVRQVDYESDESILRKVLHEAQEFRGRYEIQVDLRKCPFFGLSRPLVSRIKKVLSEEVV